jgi:hypothetical protein
MAIALYKVHVEELVFPYRRELIDTFPMSQQNDVMRFVEVFNNARGHIWSFKLEALFDKTMEEPHAKIIGNVHLT